MEAKKKEGLARLFEIASEKKKFLIISGVVSIISAFFLLFPYLMVYKIMEELLKNASSISNISGSSLMNWAIYGNIAMIIGYILLYVGAMIAHIVAYNIIYKIRIKLSEHMGKLPMGYFNKNSIGKIKSVIESDVEKIELFIAHQLPDLVSTVVMIIIIFISMLYLNFWYGLASIIPIVVGYSLQYSMLCGEKAKAGLKEYFDALESINTSAIQYVRGMSSIKIFGQTIHSFREFYNDMIAYRNFSTQYAKNYEKRYVLFNIIIASLFTFIVPVGLLFISKEPSNLALSITFIFFLILSMGISSPILKLNALATTVNRISEGLNRIDRIIEEEPIKISEDVKIPSEFDIKFNDVSFAYNENGQEVLKKIKFTACQGEITALVGPSGSGKSTIAQLIPRFWDVNNGSITIGDINIKSIENEKLMDIISFVFQDNFLLTDTILNNILIGRPNAQKKEVIDAAKAARCHEFIKALPNGYDTYVGNKGTYLSGGEKQRISVARAILKNAPILILDEATAFADPENEYEIQLALQKLIKNKTVLVIAHRLTTIVDANKIIVIEDGEISELGTHNSLIDNNGLYKKMWQAYNASLNWEVDSNFIKEVKKE
ncbi:ABC transporter ATP-binding protein/permease [Clostridium senegalense]|uniref:ABC transporter ATP-binding protein n=1 Tax=Clostridium senegalense TaxID=1465809 RepID=UPI001C121551|nr:ABC transporter ATP-binding protein [Clostridium senegalense]MBU5228216.1 ABC transporter ATP-binding protein/permease [Clostridium senegalense]